MKNICVLFILLLVFTSCKDNSKNTNNKVQSNEVNANLTKKTSMDSLHKENTVQPTGLTGTFIRNNETTPNSACNCNCVEIDFQQTSSLCLDTKSHLSILARFEKASDSTIHVYYVQPENKDNINDEKIPWNKFDTRVAIAVITYSENNAFEMDWKGFSMNGEIAMDYAIYGKKNLEGTYIRKH